MKSHRREIEHLKKDLNALKANGSGVVRDGINQLKVSGNQGLRRVEEQIREKPGQTLALGIISGLLLSYFLSRRK